MVRALGCAIMLTILSWMLLEIFSQHSTSHLSESPSSKVDRPKSLTVTDGYTVTVTGMGLPSTGQFLRSDVAAGSKPVWVNSNTGDRSFTTTLSCPPGQLCKMTDASSSIASGVTPPRATSVECSNGVSLYMTTWATTDPCASLPQ